MPRKQLIRSESHPYHVTSRSNNREWFYIPLHRVWYHCQELLKLASEKFNVKIDAFVLMNNHYHMLIYTPEANIDRFMHFFNLKLSRRISREAGRINRIFGAGYKWSLIRNQQYYINVVRYIYQNPLRAHLTNNIEKYPFSDFNIQPQHHRHIDWFNQKLNEQEQMRTKKTLRKYEI